jgi:hypothetical protein
MMSVEQWGVLALLVLVPLLEGMARLRRAPASNGRAIDRVGEMRPPQRGLVLPNRDADDTVRAVKQVVSPPPSLPFKGSASFEPHTRTGKLVAGDEVVQWLRPVRNLRRAIVVATILGPPTQ